MSKIDDRITIEVLALVSVIRYLTAAQLSQYVNVPRTTKLCLLNKIFFPLCPNTSEVFWNIHKYNFFSRRKYCFYRYGCLPHHYKKRSECILINIIRKENAFSGFVSYNEQRILENWCLKIIFSWDTWKSYFIKYPLTRV